MKSLIGIVSSCLLLLAGCSLPSRPSTTSPAGSGRVLGGQQPVVGATVQLYAVGTAGDKSPSTPLLTRPLTTDATGSFSIAGLYSCSNATQVYLVATGGDPGQGRSNPNLAMMVALGPCATLSARPSIAVNELTTVAAVNALTPYIGSPAAVGSGNADAQALDAAFAFAGVLVDPATGAAPGLASAANYTVPVDELDTLADIMASCVNSAGGIAGDGTPCGNLFRLTAPPGGPPPADTLSAMLDLAQAPSQNTAPLFQLSPPNAPFQPQLTVVPPSFLLPTPPVVSLAANPQALAFPTTTLGTSSPAQSVTIQNVSPTTVLLSSIAFVGAHAVDFTQTNDCPAALLPGASCTEHIAFSPQSSNPSAATLQIDGGTLSVAVSGSSRSAVWPETLLAAKPSVYLNFNDTTAGFLDQVSGMAFSSGGSVATQQPGFDATQPGNTAAAFGWNGWNMAPNDTLGSIDWNAPWAMVLQLDRLNWDRSGTLVLASKGDIANPAASWWALTLGIVAGHSQLCFQRNGPGLGLTAQNGFCTADYFDAMPNGFNYNLVIQDNGTGEAGIGGSGTASSLSMYIDGLQVGVQLRGGPYTNSYSTGFGAVAVSVSGGAGYADSTPFTSLGGGPNCKVTGFMAASHGVPYTGGSPVGSSNYGCTGSPTLVLASPSGSGAVLTATPAGTSMDSTTAPLMVPGSLQNGVPHGVGGTDTAQTPVVLDEFAVLPGNLSARQVSALFNQTKFYQAVALAPPNPVPVLIFDNDAGGDMDNFFSLAMVIALHKQGLIELAGAVVEDKSVTCEAAWRQMLDQAGLAATPLAVPSAFAYDSGAGFCTAANVDTFDASTPQSNAAWASSTTMYRTVFANHPAAPIDIVLAGPFTALAEFMQSPADSISPMTGLQLMAANAANGGAVYAQGLGCYGASQLDATPCSAAITADNSLLDWAAGQYVVSHNGATPIFWAGGSPLAAGPGVFSSRTTFDPLYLLAQSLGSDARQCWDCLAVEDAVSAYFYGGVQVVPSGGTGYADITPFTSTGGGPHCSVSGVMTASNGVPNGLQLPAPSDDVPYTGLGSGCDSPPTLSLLGATGSGATLTAAPTAVCGTYTITGPGAGNVSSATCSNHYFRPYSKYASSGDPVGFVMTWFINSLVNPTP